MKEWDNEDDLASLFLDREWLLSWLHGVFSVLPPFRCRTLLNNHMWHIGEAVLATTSVMIVFSRGLVRAVDLYAALAQVLERFMEDWPSTKQDTRDANQADMWKRLPDAKPDQAGHDRGRRDAD